MTITNPRVLYIILVLPTLFGVTIFADGLFRVVHGETNGFISLIIGIAVLCIVIVSYMFFSKYIGTGVGL